MARKWVGTAPSGASDLATRGVVVGKGELVLNVKDYGAVGNGTTDNTVAFQAALDALVAGGGGTLFVPPGRYVVCSGPTETRTPITLKNPPNQFIEVVGYGAVLTKTDSATFRAMFVSNNRASTTPGYGAGANNYTFRGIRFEGNFAANASICVFAFNHARNVLIEDCTFWQLHGNSGHVMDLGGCEEITVRDCEFYGWEHVGASTVAEAIQVDTSQRGANTSGIDITVSQFSGVTSRDITVEHCRFYPLTVGGTTYPCSMPFGSHAYVEGRYHERLRFLHNKVYDPPANPITENPPLNDSASDYYRGVLHMASTRDCKIIGNTFKQTVQTGRANRVIAIVGKASGNVSDQDFNSTTPVKAAWTVPNTPSNITIQDNVIDGFQVGTGEIGHDAIYIRGIDGSNGYITSVSVLDNVINNGYNGTYSATENGAAIVLENVARARIAGNQVANYLVAFKVFDSRGVVVEGNSFRNIANLSGHLTDNTGCIVRGNTWDQYGKELLVGTCVDLIIQGNTWTGPTRTGTDANGMVIVSGNYVIVAHNVIDNNTGVTQTRGIALGSAANVTNTIVKDNIIRGFTTPVNPASLTGYTNTVNSPNY